MTVVANKQIGSRQVLHLHFFLEGGSRRKEHDLTDQDSPLFLFYAFHLLHTPLQLPNSYLEEIDKLANASGQQQLPWTQNRRLYAGMTLYLDTMIGRVIKELQRRRPAAVVFFRFCCRPAHGG